MPECERCRTGLAAATGGVVTALGLVTLEGYRCRSCGALVCDDCYRERRVELVGAAFDRCPTCRGSLTKR